MFALVLFVLQAVQPLTFRIPDGTKRDSYIGNLPQNANLKSSSSIRQFLIVTGSDLIQVSKRLIKNQFTHTRAT